MSNLAIAESHQVNSAHECTGSLKDVWDGTYIWVGQFVRGANNRILFARFVDQIITAQMTMGERYTAISDFIAYYRQITEETPEQTHMDRLYAWARGNYDPVDYPHYTQEELKRRNGKFERPLSERNELPEEYRIHGRIKAGMVVFSEDISFKLGRLLKHNI
ncbi:hypothetical protein [Paenibacillus terrigena]|uniref:hypothetical protein n=1 Tax=Paenibacillus terrigena TaxID=369333 RepID=UPI0028D554EF|nr:hypothetical protein [Paenibacillus terrigena]